MQVTALLFFRQLADRLHFSLEIGDKGIAVQDMMLFCVILLGNHGIDHALCITAEPVNVALNFCAVCCGSIT